MQFLSLILLAASALALPRLPGHSKITFLGGFFAGQEYTVSEYGIGSHHAFHVGDKLEIEYDTYRVRYNSTCHPSKEECVPTLLDICHSFPGTAKKCDTLDLEMLEWDPVLGWWLLENYKVETNFVVESVGDLEISFRSYNLNYDGPAGAEYNNYDKFTFKVQA